MAVARVVDAATAPERTAHRVAVPLTRTRGDHLDPASRPEWLWTNP